MLTPIRVLSDGPVRVELARWHPAATGQVTRARGGNLDHSHPDGDAHSTLATEGRLVITKTLTTPSEDTSLRLRREAEVARKLHHRNIVPLLAVEGETLIYDYRAGISLQEYMQRQGGLELAHALHLIDDILQALEYAHAHQVIHCDIKPSNIILELDANRPHHQRALLNDFGFAKDLALASITLQGMRLGTPHYMAPEQFEGVRHDPRVDIYAIGATLYHMLCNWPPYQDGVIPFLLGHPAILKPLPSHAHHLHDFVVMRALATKAHERFQSAHEMRQALSILLAEEL